MNKEELIKARDLVKEQFSNLSNANWVAAELHHLRGKFDILNEVILSLEGEENAQNNQTESTDSDDDQGEQSVS